MDKAFQMLMNKLKEDLVEAKNLLDKEKDHSDKLLQKSLELSHNYENQMKRLESEIEYMK